MTNYITKQFISELSLIQKFTGGGAIIGSGLGLSRGIFGRIKINNEIKDLENKYKNSTDDMQKKYYMTKIQNLKNDLNDKYGGTKMTRDAIIGGTVGGSAGYGIAKLFKKKFKIQDPKPNTKPDNTPKPTTTKTTVTNNNATKPDLSNTQHNTISGVFDNTPKPNTPKKTTDRNLPDISMIHIIDETIESAKKEHINMLNIIKNKTKLDIGSDEIDEIKNLSIKELLDINQFAPYENIIKIEPKFTSIVDKTTYDKFYKKVEKLRSFAELYPDIIKKHYGV